MLIWTTNIAAQIVDGLRYTSADPRHGGWALYPQHFRGTALLHTLTLLLACLPACLPACQPVYVLEAWPDSGHIRHIVPP